LGERVALPNDTPVNSHSVRLLCKPLKRFAIILRESVPKPKDFREDAITIDVFERMLI